MESHALITNRLTFSAAGLSFSLGKSGLGAPKRCVKMEVRYMKAVTFMSTARRIADSSPPSSCHPEQHGEMIRGCE